MSQLVHLHARVSERDYCDTECGERCDLVDTAYRDRDPERVTCLACLSAALTRTQSRALADLRAHGHLWPSGRGRYAVSGTGHPPYSRRTLDALVTAGLAVWAPMRHGVMPHVVPAEGVRS